MEQQRVELSEITDSDVGRVAAYLNERLNPKVSVAAWAEAMTPQWQVQAPNHGFLLTCDEAVVGAGLAIYSVRMIQGRPERFCNLGALCVDEQYRSHTFRLVRAALGQRGLHFTDLSPSGNVVGLNERLGFKHLDTTTALVANLPRLRRAGGVRIVTDHDEIAESLDDQQRQVFTDHRHAAAARHILVRSGDDSCYVIFRRDRRKKLPLFASILYVSDQATFARTSSTVFRHLLLHHGVVATLAELRVVGEQPPHSTLLTAPRRKMYHSRTLPAGSIDYLYSELTCLAW